jgi:pimeloyl-ACP methyl ester carboxylesterase
MRRCARFELIAQCGHLPQIEQPQWLHEVLAGVDRRASLRR